MSEIVDYTGSNIRACRKYADMSRAQLLKELEKYGISLHQSSLKRMEDGDQPVKVHEALALSEIFDVELYDFVSEPLNGSEGKLNALTSRYRSAITGVLTATWAAIESRDNLKNALEKEDHISPARREAEAFVNKDGPLYTAMLNLTKAWNRFLQSDPRSKEQ